MTTRGRVFSLAIALTWCGALPAAPQSQQLEVVVTVDPGVAQAAILATNSAHVHSGVQVTGNVVANEALGAASLVPGRSVSVDRTAHVAGEVSGDVVGLARNAAVDGTVHANQVFDAGATLGGGIVTPLSLPVLAPLPSFNEAAVRSDAANVTVASGTTITLAPGEYGDLVVAPFATVIFGGGVYDLRSIQAAPGAICAFPCRVFAFDGPADVRVEGRVDFGRQARVGPSTSATTAAQIVFHVGGANGGAGGPLDLPAAIAIGRESVVQANLFSRGGTVRVDRDSQITGALLGRDVKVDNNTSVVLASHFDNLAPVAEPAVAFTNGAAAIEIVLSASDPEGGDLTFSIVSGPTLGSLGPVNEAPVPFPGSPPGCNPENVPGCVPPEPPRTSATVTYTPPGENDVEDSFVFAATDPQGAIGTATVSINPPEPPEPPEPPLDTVRAVDGSHETPFEAAVSVRLLADAPTGVATTFAMVAGPGNGTLGALVQGTEVPQRSATVIYTPADGFEGVDSFVFEACGVIASVTECDQGTATIFVRGRLAENQAVQTSENTEVTVTLGGTPGAGTSSLRVPVAHAAFLDGAEIAGNVADANDDGFGDNHNELPGSAPGLMSAGVDLSGGPGSNGVVRMQIEWDISTLHGLAGSLQSAEVLLSTHRGTIDSLPTYFFVATADGNGTLDDGDFELPAVPISGAVMPVVGTVGSDGSFSFDVTGLLRSVLASDRDFFVIQGRVDEQLANGDAQRGLEVRTTASGNLLDHSEPQLAIATPGVTPPELTFSVFTLPASGTLKTSADVPISSAPFTLSDAIVRYKPNPLFTGLDSFQFQVADALNVATATVSITVFAGVDPCAADGREPGCQD